jgi:hypothetical protein
MRVMYTSMSRNLSSPARSVGEGDREAVEGAATPTRLLSPSGAEFIFAPAFGRWRGHHAMHARGRKAPERTQDINHAH